jgi:hypothetical protein
LREGRRALEAQLERERRPSAGDRAERFSEACRRLEQELDADRAANAAYARWRAHGVAADGSRRMAPKGQVVRAARGADRVAECHDHDSRVVRTQGQPGMQGYNAQLAVNGRQIMVAAEITTESPDFGHLEPLVRATQRELTALGLGDPTSCWRTPATGISARCSRSPARASKCSCRPTPACADAHGRAGPAGRQHLCGRPCDSSGCAASTNPFLSFAHLVSRP